MNDEKVAQRLQDQERLPRAAKAKPVSLNHGILSMLVC